MNCIVFFTVVSVSPLSILSRHIEQMFSAKKTKNFDKSTESYSPSTEQFPQELVEAKTELKGEWMWDIGLSGGHKHNESVPRLPLERGQKPSNVTLNFN